MKLNKYVHAALSCAIVCVATICIVVPINGVGYVNLGDSAIMLLASLFEPKLAFLVGGVGSAIADMTLGYAHYALFTLIIKGIEGVLISKLINDNKNKNISFISGGLIVIIGYYLVDVLFTKSLVAPFMGVITNCIQIGFCMIIANLLTPMINRLRKQFFS